MTETVEDPVVTDSHIRTRISHRLNDTGDVVEVSYLEQGTDDLPDHLTSGIDRPIPTLHVQLQSANITNAVMRVLSDEGLSVTPLSPTDILADGGTPGKIWMLSPEFWAQFVRVHALYSEATPTELHKLAEAIVADEENNPDIETLEEAFQEIEDWETTLNMFVSPLTEAQYDALRQLGDAVISEDISVDDVEDHVTFKNTMAGEHGIELRSSDSEMSVDDWLQSR